ncbi:hypothetical protein STEG23_036136, partial [Scotinomys teguina]
MEEGIEPAYREKHVMEHSKHFRNVIAWLLIAKDTCDTSETEAPVLHRRLLFLLAARTVEEDSSVPPAHDVIRISQCKCTASDIKRMEKIISEKLHYELEATTALKFLHLYHAIVFCHTSERKETLSLDKLEAQLKACSCRLVFSKAKPSVLALCLLNLEIETVKSIELLEILLLVKKHLK